LGSLKHRRRKCGPADADRFILTGLLSGVGAVDDPVDIVGTAPRGDPFLFD